ncbi:hypothetical protein [Aminobacter sp. HY435]|uniref:hypothetical protein n=1 Tax=Aminobacter sp. HY435 TaxID=2970917 RepID=UPI0022B9AE37|nr:hypothetical protein [Aminobacter sp. HY435]
MAMSRKQEERALSQDERQLVEKSRHPAVQELSDADLRDLIKTLRERRDKAQSDAHRLRREMRGKAVPKGAQAATRDQGTKVKLGVLAMAMRRLNSEHERRRQLVARIDLVENARAALALKQDKKPARGADFNTRQAHQGMRAVENTRAKSLVRPMERGRLRKAAAVAQAKRDAK